MGRGREVHAKQLGILQHRDAYIVEEQDGSAPLAMSIGAQYASQAAPVKEPHQSPW